MEKLKYCATCLFGLEGLVGQEIDELGYTRLETIDGRIYFEGDVSAIPRCNINLRCAERVYIVAGQFYAETFTELFDGTKAIPWEKYIRVNDAFPNSGHSVKSQLTSIPDCQSIVKKAMVERLKSVYNVDWFEENETKLKIEFFILDNKATLMIDTSGEPLFKRGYREKSAEAPLRETLAAALVKLSRPRENVITYDPFCGSGTIAIEAALIMTNTAPGINRRFSSEHYSFIDKKYWKEARREAQEKINPDTPFMAWASDISKDCVKLTLENAKRAGMEKHIKVFTKDALTITDTGERMTVVCNPPYGERLGTIREARELYKKLGKAFSTLVPPWQMYLLTSEEDFQYLYGRRCDKSRKLYNGMIKCYLYQYYKKDGNTRPFAGKNGFCDKRK